MTGDRASRARRLDFYRHAIRCAAVLGSDCVSLWSGRLREPLDRTAALNRLLEGLGQVLDYATAAGVRIAFEPEPGMFIDSMADFAELVARLGSSPLGLTLDIGHAHCQGETPIAEVIRAWRERLNNVHIEDMRRGRHEHLMFGEGEIDFPPVVAALAEVGYAGGVYVELSRHSHLGPVAARQAIEFLDPLLTQASSP
jgi:sugar phosphate isomerase/epimerase